VNPDDQIVFVVDDDEGVRTGLCSLLKTMGLKTREFVSAMAFLAECRAAWSGCLLLDVRMPGLSGLELQKRLLELDIRLPVILLTGHADVPMAVRAMKLGAVDFLEKPFNEQELLDRIQRALALDARQRAEQEASRALTARGQTLTDREREVLDLLVAGKLNKVIAAELEISERTVEHHRASVMRKLSARSLAELVQFGAALRTAETSPAGLTGVKACSP
jgi:two-component system, LuxR family, response regulator FixJ